MGESGGGPERVGERAKSYVGNNVSRILLINADEMRGLGCRGGRGRRGIKGEGRGMGGGKGEC